MSNKACKLKFVLLISIQNLNQIPGAAQYFLKIRKIFSYFQIAIRGNQITETRTVTRRRAVSRPGPRLAKPAAEVAPFGVSTQMRVWKYICCKKATACLSCFCDCHGFLCNSIPRFRLLTSKWQLFNLLLVLHWIVLVRPLYKGSFARVQMWRMQTVGRRSS